MRVERPRLNRAYLILAVAAMAPTAGGAAVWQSSPWALSPSVATGFGYDSNIFSRANGEGDGFAEITPMLRLSAPPSLTFFSVEASAHAVTYAHWPSQGSVDPALRMQYRYPNQEGVLATREMNAAVSQASVANSDIGRRVRETEWFFDWEGTVAATAKTELQARLSARRLSYGEIDLNTNDSADAGLTLAFVANEKLQLGAGYDFSLSRSVPEVAGGRPTRRVENALTFRGRGEFSPNISGRLYLGLANANYSGAQSRSDLDFVLGADLGWKIRERLHLTAKADRRVYFSPEGDAAQETSAAFELSQEFSGGFSASIGAQGVRTVYRRSTAFRHDTSFPLRMRLDYMVNQRFSAAIEGSWSEQHSDWEFRNYHRTTSSARILYHF
jgi:Putative beta-barrel porin 2